MQGEVGVRPMPRAVQIAVARQRAEFSLQSILRSFTYIMKPSFRVLSLLAVTLTAGASLCVAQAAPASIPSAPAPAGAEKIGIVAFQPAIAQTKEGQKALQDLQAKFAPKQAELKAQSAAIDTLKKQLQDGGAKLTAAERASKVKSIDEKEKALQQAAEQAQGEFQQAIAGSFQGIARKFDALLQDYCKKNGYTAVFDISSQQSNVVYATRSADITRDVIAAYDQQEATAKPAATTPTPAATQPAAGDAK